MRRLLVIGFAASVLAGACDGKAEPLVPTATVPQGTTTTNPYAVPLMIDETYVNRVLAGLDIAVGDVTRLVMSAGTITDEAADRLEALYVGDALVFKLQSFQNDVLQQFSGYRPHPGNKETTITELITARSSCVFAKFHKDFSESPAMRILDSRLNGSSWCRWIL